jgi:hypothetical protein
MPRLRITQSNDDRGRHRVDLEFQVKKAPRQTATATFDFSLEEKDQDDLRWYLEDFLQFPQDPNPKIAARVERRMAEIGKDLFVKVFHSSDDARDLWAELRAKLDGTHVEVVTSVEGATAIPWELIRDPKTDVPLALRAAVFARAHPRPAQQPQVPRTKSGPIRILLVICRTDVEKEVPFRSVASRLIKGLSERHWAKYQLDVLRPPTFEQLGQVLRRAREQKQPYHVVHFDGSGIYAKLTDEGDAAQIFPRRLPVISSALRTGRHGFLLFESPQHPENVALVDGPTLGNLLVETGVPVLVVNACRSAHADVETVDDEGTRSNGSAQRPPVLTDPHERVRAVGSLAQEVMDAGVAGVVAMRYNVYVVTAARFVADFYAALVRGQTVGAAATTGRKQLAANPDRAIAFDPRPLQDWFVPVVYESLPIGLFPAQKKAEDLTIAVKAGDTTSGRGTLDDNLPRAPDAGFFGRDETLLALDRAFDTQTVVLLHDYAGSGKTSTAAEFARWYSQTGGIAGPVLFTSFENHRPPARVLDRIGEVFGRELEKGGVNWSALDEKNRRVEALQVLEQVPVLWIWDNVEPIAGFPKGTPSKWTDAEQRELANFLRDARGTKARFLLTSRRDERDWLGDLPGRIRVPSMPMQERVQLTRALAERRGHRIADVEDWTPLLRFTEGNPLTITVLVGQVLRDGLTTKRQIEDYVSELHAGTAQFDDEASEGRTRSLGASLAYGFEHSFSEDERKRLSVLHLFQGFVEADTLSRMGRTDAEWCLPELRGMTREEGIALLDRAAEVGILNSLGDGYYTIHPAVPWFFKGLFDSYYPGPETRAPGGQPGGDDTPAGHATQAFVEGIGGLGSDYHRYYNQGNRDVVRVLGAEEANLLHARRLARRHGWWGPVINAMEGLDDLYDHTGRRAEWKALVDEIVPDFVDPITDRPRPGREEGWSFVTAYRANFARDAGDGAEAERLQRLRVDRDRRLAEDIVDRYSGRLNRPIGAEASEASGPQDRPTPPGDLPPLRDRLAAVLPRLSVTDKNAVRSLAVTLDNLGGVQLTRQDPGGIASYEEAFHLAEQIGERTEAAVCAYNLGKAHMGVLDVVDLARAEEWLQRCLERLGDHDRLGRGKCYSLVGTLARLRFQEAQGAGAPVAVVLGYVGVGMEAFRAALELIPEHAVSERADLHVEFGHFSLLIGNVELARFHYNKSIGYEESQGNTLGGARTRVAFALALIQSGRFPDAREYAVTARDQLANLGAASPDETPMAQQLIDWIDATIAGQPAGSDSTESRPAELDAGQHPSGSGG